MHLSDNLFHKYNLMIFENVSLIGYFYNFVFFFGNENNVHCQLFIQEQVEEMKKKEERMEKQMNEIMAENKRLTEPLQKAREEVEELRKQVRYFNTFYEVFSV